MNLVSASHHQKKKKIFFKFASHREIRLQSQALEIRTNLLKSERRKESNELKGWDNKTNKHFFAALATRNRKSQ